MKSLNKDRIFHRISAILLFVSSHIVSGGFKMHSTDQNHIVNTGGELSLQCKFYKSEFNLFDNPVQWRKSQQGEESEMNMMGNIKQPFESTGRFTVTYDPQPPTYTLTLTIKNISRVDSGNYTCDVKGPKSAELGSVQYTVFTRAPVTEVYIVQGNGSYMDVSPNTLSFMENESSPLRCISKGGSPPPEMEITIGRENYTKYFRFDSVYSVSGVVGFRILQATSMMVTDGFRATANDNGKKLKCKSKVPGLPQVVKTADLSVHYAPRITCTSALAYVGKRNVRLNCSVSAHPPITSWYWLLDDSTRISEGDVIQGLYWTLYTPDEAKNALNLVLYIRQTSEESFRTYDLVVSNNVASRMEQVHLRQQYLESELNGYQNDKEPTYKNRQSGRVNRDPSSLYANDSPAVTFRQSFVPPTVTLLMTLRIFVDL